MTAQRQRRGVVVDADELERRIFCLSVRFLNEKGN
jgi:hypothetical protein